MVDRAAVLAKILQHLLIGFDHWPRQHFSNGDALERGGLHDFSHQAAALNHFVDVFLRAQVIGVDQRCFARVVRSNLDAPSAGGSARVEAQQKA